MIFSKKFLTIWTSNVKQKYDVIISFERKNNNFILCAAYALLKSNKGKKLVTILFVTGSGSILFGSVVASQVTLNGETKVVFISQLEEITVDENDCSDYIWYIIVKGDETTTTVTTESRTTKVTTTETPTTGTPTTEVPTTGETTTEEITEETTEEEQTELEEEVTIKPGTPSAT